MDGPKAGETFAQRYLIESELGSGGMGCVYKAYDNELGRHVAVKIMHRLFSSSSESLARFRREAQVLSRLEHKNLARVYTFGLYRDKYPYIVMEFVRGESLRQILARNKKLSPEQCISFSRQLASCLDYVHSQGVLHRDLKPENVVVDQYNEAKLLDFGLCKPLPHSGMDFDTLTGDGALIGSVHYMPPEIMSGRLDQRSDIYSLACMLYEMLSGQAPFNNINPLAIIHQHVNVEPASLLSMSGTECLIPAGLSRAVMKGLNKNPEQRFDNMAELCQALDDIDLSDIASSCKKRSRFPIYAVLTSILLVVSIYLYCSDPGWLQLILPVLGSDQNKILDLAAEMERTNRPKASVLCYEKCLLLVGKDGMRRAQILMALSRVQLAMGNKQAALTLAWKSVDSISSTYTVLSARNYTVSNSPEFEKKAREILRQLIPVLSDTNAKLPLAIIERALKMNYINCMTMPSLACDLDRALLLQAVSSVGVDHDLVGSILQNLAESERKCQQFSLAIADIDKSIAIAKHGDRRYLSVRYLEKALIYMDQGKYVEAIANCKLASKIDTQNYVLLRANIIWAEAEELLGRRTAALERLGIVERLLNEKRSDQALRFFMPQIQSEFERLKKLCT